MDALGSTFLTFVDGELVPLNFTHLEGKTIGLYFSAHWCPPCRSFTPVLADVYNELRKKHDCNFEVVFVSRDRDHPSFMNYLKTMPWIAVPFEDAATRNSLAAKYGANGIPKLVVLGPDGQVIAKSAVGTIRRAGVEGSVAQYPWKGAGEGESEGGGINPLFVLVVLFYLYQAAVYFKVDELLGLVPKRQ